MKSVKETIAQVDGELKRGVGELSQRGRELSQRGRGTLTEGQGIQAGIFLKTGKWNIPREGTQGIECHTFIH